jgi:hypothetical protein
VEAALVAVIVACVVGALVLRGVRLRRHSFDTQLAANLRLYGLTLVHSRPPPLLRRGPFRRIVSLARDAADYTDSYSATRIVTVRAPDGREHSVWARLDVDAARPRAGLDEVQIEWSPALKTLGNR